MSNNRTFFKNVKEGHMSLKDIFSDVLKKHTPEESARVLIAGTPLTTPKEAEMLSGWQKPFLFLRFFAACAAIMAMAWFISRLGFPAGNDVMLIVAAILLPVTLLILAWEMNIPRDISLMEVLKIVVIGGILSLVLNAIFAQFRTIFSVMSGYSLGDAVWAPVIEEPAKLAVIYFILTRRNRKYILDGVLIGMAVGTGFAVIETLNYVMLDMRESIVAALVYSMQNVEGSPADVMELLAAIVEDSDALFELVYNLYVGTGYKVSLDTAISRGLGSLASHGTYAALYGGGLMIAKGAHPVKPRHLLHLDHLKYFAVAYLLHAANNSRIQPYTNILFNYKYAWAIIESIVMMAFFLPLLRRGVNQIVDISAAHNGGRVTQAVNRGAAPGYQSDSRSVGLEWVSGPNAGQTFAIREGQSLTLGRSSGCNIAVPGAGNVSGTHCMLRLSGGVLTVTDLDSTNGTYIADRRLPANQATAVADGAVICLGNRNCSFRVRIR